MYLHTDSKGFSCRNCLSPHFSSPCAKSFQTPSGRARHERLCKHRLLRFSREHINNQDKSCVGCKKIFKTIALRNFHVKAHERETAGAHWHCNICYRNFFGPCKPWDLYPAIFCNYLIIWKVNLKTDTLYPYTLSYYFGSQKCLWNWARGLILRISASD